MSLVKRVEVFSCEGGLSEAALRSLAPRLAKNGFLRPALTIRAQELLYLPYYFFSHLNPNLADRMMLYPVLVDGIVGFCDFVKGLPSLKPFRIEWEQFLEKAVLKEEARKKAKAWVQEYILRKQPWKVRRIAVELLEEVEFHYPYWVVYLQGRRGPELRALDALSGKRATPKTERALEMGIARHEWLKDVRQDVS